MDLIKIILSLILCFNVFAYIPSEKVVTTDRTQTITGAKTFSTDTVFSSDIAIGGGDINANYNTGSTTTAQGFRMYYFGNTTLTGGIDLDVGANVRVNSNPSSVILATGGTTRLTVANSGGVTIATTGGNVPHNCSLETATNAVAQSVTSSCSANRILISGRCSTYGASLLNSGPISTTSWNCFYQGAGGTNTAQAYCCNY